MSEAREIKVLVIDDDEMALTIIGKMLEAEGFGVDVSLSARDALNRLSERRYDAIFCDMWMPGMTGSQFYQQVKDEYPQYRSRVIFITGDIASEATWDFIDQRKLPYVLKPFSSAELRRKLEDVIGDWKAAAPEPEPSGFNRRRHHRVAMKASVRVRKKKWATGGPDIAAIVDVSKEGLYFITSQDYRLGTEVWVAFPYTGANDVEQDGYIVRVEKRAEGKRGIAIAMGQAAVSARNALLGTDEERRRKRILAMADMSGQTPMLDAVAEEVAVSSELKAKIKTEREEARRLADELEDMKVTYERVGTQRDRLAAQEIHLNLQLTELAAAKSAMTEVVDDLKEQMEDLQKQLAASEAFRYQATHDSLTGLWNRAAILDILRRELARGQREDTPIGIVVVDLDHFKSVNDNHGHQAGDVVLQEAARRMVAAVRDYDAVGRYGGEEFLIVLSGCDTETTTRQAERIREAIGAEEMDAGPARLRVTASMGVVTSSISTESEAMFRSADAALYRAKRGGRNRVELGTAEEAPQKTPAAGQADPPARTEPSPAAR